MTSSRNSSGNRTLATAGTTATRIPSAEAAAEVVAAAAAATNHRCVLVSFSFSFFFFSLLIYKFYTIEYTTITLQQLPATTKTSGSNRLSHDKLTTTSSRNSNGNRTPATAGTTATRLPSAEAAAEVVADRKSVV